MAANAIVSLLGYLTTDTRADVEKDAAGAPYSSISIRVENVAGAGGFINALVPTSLLNNAPATPPAAAPTLTASTTGGSLASGTEYVKVAYNTANGPTLPSAEASVVVTGPTGSVSVASPPAQSGLTTYAVYAGNAAGQETLIAASVNIGTAYVIQANPAAGQPGPATSAPAAVPLINTAQPCSITISQGAGTLNTPVAQ